MSEPLPPFGCTYTPNIPELLNDLNISLTLSTHQTGKIVFLYAPDKNKMIQLPRNFEKAIGVAIKGDKGAISDTRIPIGKGFRKAFFIL